MDIIFLGTGSAFCLKNFHSNALIVENNKKILFDAGGDLRFSLNEQGLSYNDIDAVYISHLHNDHIGGLEYLGLESYFSVPRHKIKLYIHKKLIDDLWNSSLSGGLRKISTGELHLHDYFDVITVEDSFNWQGHNIELIETVHSADVLNVHPVFGLFINCTSGKKVYLTADTRYVPEIIGKFYEKADFIIHDTETANYRSEIHSHYDDLIHLDGKVKMKTYLWHYQDNVSDNFEIWQENARKNQFIGFLKKGQKLSF